MEELLKQRIIELYKEYLSNINNPNEKERMKYCYGDGYGEIDLDQWVLKVLVDLYSLKEFEDHQDSRLIYHDWDIIEACIKLMMEE
jgi:hypothetical protein